MSSQPNLSLDPRQKMLRVVKGLMLSRIIILTLLLAISFFFQLSEKRSFFVPMTNAFYYFLILFYLVTIVYAVLLKRIKDLHRFVFIQIVLDHLFITFLIFFTGGKDSFFPIAYVFSIIGSSLVFYKRGAFFSASLSTFLYGLLLLLQLHYGVTPQGQVSFVEASQVFYSMMIYMATFYIVAFLSSAVSEELKKKKRELFQKEVDYNELEAFNRNIIQSLDSGLLTIDLDGQINFMNRTAEKILARSGEVLIARSIFDLFPEIGRALDQLRAKGSDAISDYQRYETVFAKDDENKIYLGFSISPLTNLEGSLIGHTLIFQDITRFKEMEDQMKRIDTMAAVGLLAAGMAHEIRNPLAALSGSIQVLKSELTLNDHQDRLMEITLRESERLNALITDFLLFAQPPQIHREHWNVVKLLDETIELFRHSPSFHEGMEIRRPNPLGNVETMIDRDQIKQVLWNLLINAAQAMDQKGTIEVGWERGRESRRGLGAWPTASRNGKEWLKISIRDSGPGIHPQDKDKIFEPFFTTKEGGTGLGLSIVHKIVENHNGMIKVETEMGRGTTFMVFLPIEVDEGRKDAERQDPRG